MWDQADASTPAKTGHSCRVPHPFAHYAKGWETTNASAAITIGQFFQGKEPEEKAAQRVSTHATRPA
jgi:hypothetical protein